MERGKWRWAGKEEERAMASVNDKIVGVGGTHESHSKKLDKTLCIYAAECKRRKDSEEKQNTERKKEAQRERYMDSR